MARSKLHVDDKDDNQCYECGQKGHWYVTPCSNKMQETTLVYWHQRLNLNPTFILCGVSIPLKLFSRSFLMTTAKHDLKLTKNSWLWNWAEIVLCCINDNVLCNILSTVHTVAWAHNWKIVISMILIISIWVDILYRNHNCHKQGYRKQF